MKYLNKFEKFGKFEYKPKYGDYIKIKHYSKNIDLSIYYETHIGKVIDCGDENILVAYKEKPEESILKYFYYNNERDDYSEIFSINNIVEFGKTKEELELKLASKKYNL